MIEITIAMIVFLFPLAYSPGPGNMFFAAIGARDGFAATVPANLGYHLATLIVTLAIGFGFASIIHALPEAMEILRWAGSAYVMYLAWKIANAPPPEAAGAAKAASFADGAMLLLLNPKAYVILALLFTQFAEGADTLTIIWIAVVFTINNLVAFGIYAYAGHQLLSLAGGAGNARLMNCLFAAVLVAVALWIVTK